MIQMNVYYVNIPNAFNLYIICNNFHRRLATALKHAYDVIEMCIYIVSWYSVRDYRPFTPQPLP